MPLLKCLFFLCVYIIQIIIPFSCKTNKNPLDSSNFVQFIDNADTTTIEYTFTITNNDVDDLYVFDPDKMGSDLFHYFTNGPTFQSLKTHKLYEPRWRNIPQVEPFDYWSESWFTLIKPGQSITKNVILRGYPYFPLNEEYIVEFVFPGLQYNAEKEKREMVDARIWVGSTKSNVWQFELISRDKISSISISNNSAFGNSRRSFIINRYRSNISREIPPVYE